MSAAIETTPSRPDIAEFSDYRAFLRALIKHLKATQRWFSYRSFSRRAGFKSPNFLKQVAEGDRNLSTASIAKFAHGLGLSDDEHATFESLVHLDQSRTDDERNLHYRRLAKRAQAGTVAHIEADQYEVYTRWYTIPIRELARLPGFVEDAVAIGRRLRPRVRPERVKRALAVLERLELLARDGQGRLRARDESISTGPTVRSLAIRNFHRAMLELASRALDELHRDRRNVTSLTVALSARQYERATDVISRLRREILDIAADHSDRDEADLEVYQVMFSLFPVTQQEERR